MIDARTQAEAGMRLEAALRAAGIAIERGVLSGGNLRSWEPVSGVHIIGRLQAATGWRIRTIDPTEASCHEIRRIQ